MISVLMVVPNRTDATSLYRSMGPFSDMRRQQEFNMVFTEQVDWSILSMVDCVFMQRPYTGQHRQIAEMCKSWGTPLWVDYDDLLFDLPSDNPAYPLYMNGRTKEDLVALIRSATVVTVSTPQLKRCLQLEKLSLNDRVYVVPNALMDRLLRHEQHHSAKPLISWRGSKTHARDLACYLEPMVELARDRPKTTWNFIGDNPWFITEAMGPKQAIVAPGLAIGDYFDYMSRINPSVHIVPLHDSMFNRCKSNIAWIEATLAGAVTVAPEWEEWIRPGALTYKDEAGFRSCIEYALDHPEEMAQQHQMSREFIREHLLLSVVNRQKRLPILNALNCLSRGIEPSWPEGGEREEHFMELE